MGDVINSLRKLSFPLCAKEALQVISQLIVTPNSSGNISTKTLQLVCDTIEEFVFLEKDSGSPDLHKGKLTSLEELQLLDLLCNFLSHSAIHTVRNRLFLCLFPIKNDRRIDLLVKLVAMAVATKTTEVLNATGVWLQQNGCNTSCGVSIAQSIVNDYLLLVPDAFEQLHDLPHLAPEFAANLLAAMAECYNSTTKDPSPPNALIKLAAFWAWKSPDLCTTALTACHPPTMPFIALVRWCVLVPIISQDEQKPYSKLHLALMESVLLSSKDSLVNADVLVGLLDLMKTHMAAAESNSVKRAIDRFTQIVIVLLRTGKVAGNLGELCQKMESLPRNDLLECFGACRNLILSPPHFRQHTIL